MDRRQFLESTLAAGIASLLVPAFSHGAETSNLKLTTFRIDVTPPMGHPLCGGWIKPVVGVDDPLEAIGFVLTGSGDPIVVCAVDWTGLLNEAHIAWRTSLAKAVGTTPDRVAVHCVHQHNAPFVCLEAQKIVSAHQDLPPVVFVDFFHDCVKRAGEAAAAAMQKLQPVTHVATSQAKVEKVAGNRRFVDANGKLYDHRGSSSKLPRHWELPEGLIDPWMKTVALYNGEKKILSCHYYATHPMSYYGDGRPSSDFAGLARKRRQAEEPECTHIYFTGCSGDVAAGKYNNGSPEARVQLTDRMYAAMVASEAELSPQPIAQVAWQTAPVSFPVRDGLTEESLLAKVADPKIVVAERNRCAMRLGWLRRCARQEPIILSALHLNGATLLHLPSEMFIAYQLRAQSAAPDRFVATAAYGDGGSWYIPTTDAFPQGGYEVSVAFSNPETDGILTKNFSQLAQGTSAKQS